MSTRSSGQGEPGRARAFGAGGCDTVAFVAVLPRPSAVSLPALPALAALAALFVAGCATGASIPDPRVAAEAYASAAERGDADAIYGMLSKRSQATISKAEVQASVGAARAELKDQAAEVRKAAPSIVAVARVRYEDGSEASLTLEDGRFYVASAGVLPGGGSTPEEALAAFRETLKRRSYPAMLRVLTPTVRAAVEAQLRGLVEALADPSAVQIPATTGDELDVKLKDGHRVKLRRENKIWYVENFE